MDDLGCRASRWPRGRLAVPWGSGDRQRARRRRQHVLPGRPSLPFPPRALLCSWGLHGRARPPGTSGAGDARGPWEPPLPESQFCEGRRCPAGRPTAQEEPGVRGCGAWVPLQKARVLPLSRSARRHLLTSGCPRPPLCPCGWDGSVVLRRLPCGALRKSRFTGSHMGLPVRRTGGPPWGLCRRGRGPSPAYRAPRSGGFSWGAGLASGHSRRGGRETGPALSADTCAPSAAPCASSF